MALVRRSSAIALSLVFAALGPACGDDGGGGDGGDLPDGGGDGDGDGDGDGPDGGSGDFVEPAEGQFVVREIKFGEDGVVAANLDGTIMDPRPVYQRLEMEAGACRLWRWSVTSCDDCQQGICDSDGVCVPYPVQLSAGPVTFEGLADPEVLVVPPSEYGYYPAEIVDDAFEPGSAITASAGGAQVDAFELEAAGVPEIAVELEQGGEKDQRETLRLVDGDDLVLSWSPAEPGTRVRLDILSNNRGHGLPVDVRIECEGDDTGSLVVPQAMIEAFPEKPFQYICAGSDCPPSSLVRYTRDRATAGDVEIELRVEFQAQFVVVHET